MRQRTVDGVWPDVVTRESKRARWLLCAKAHSLSASPSLSRPRSPSLYLSLWPYLSHLQMLLLLLLILPLVRLVLHDRASCLRTTVHTHSHRHKHSHRHRHTHTLRDTHEILLCQNLLPHAKQQRNTAKFFAQFC